MAIKKSQLYNTLWESCNALRGSMDASQYKDYVLIMLFVKYLSDKAGQQGFRLQVPDGCHFSDFVALKQDSSIGEKINIKLEAIKERNVRYIGDLALPNFNDPQKLGAGKTMVDTLSRLIGVFENDALDFSHNRAADDDLLGDAYEYLMKNFAAESGKSKGQFYTPAEVSRIIAKVLRIDQLDRAEQSIYDPACGSGSLLLRALAEASNPRVSIRGQEKDSTTASLAKLNMLLHGISSADIKVGDTLGDPQFTTAGGLQTFDVCVANPPFSLKPWMPTNGESDQYNRWNPNLLPPAKCGDYAFLLHLIHSMKPEDGRGACVLPHGVLFRGNAEAKIREYIISRRFIKGIIGLPSNIFFGTGIPASIIVIDKKDALSRKGIFFIDAKDGFRKEGAKNRLREQDIRRIIDAWEAQRDIPHFCRMVEWDEIRANQYNLNIPRYITPADNEIIQDIEAHLEGGLPEAEIDKMERIWHLCPTLKAHLFKPSRDRYMALAVAKDDITATIENEPSFDLQKKIFHDMLAEWCATVASDMKTVSKGVRPKELISRWSSLLLQKAATSKGLVDEYEVYDVLMNYWAETMQDDCYMLSNDGWTLPPVRAVLRKESKDKKTGETKVKETACFYDDIVCDLLPVDILLDEYFVKEQQSIRQAEQAIEAKQTKMDQLVEENAEAFTFSDTNDDNETDGEKELTVKEADVRYQIKAAKTRIVDPQDMAVWKQWLELLSEKKSLQKSLKELRAALTDAIVKKYASLTEEDIKHLVVDCKWLKAVNRECSALLQTATHELTAEVHAIVKRYEKTLPEIEQSVSDAEMAVKEYLKQMGME